MDKELLLIGSVPLETTEEVFAVSSKELGAHLPCLPDGETGERIWWINTLAYHVFHGHPDIVTINRPPRENGVEKWKPADANELWEFKVREGVDSVRFGDPGWRLGYAKDAIASYFVFKTLRKEGVIPKDVRFHIISRSVAPAGCSRSRDARLVINPGRIATSNCGNGCARWPTTIAVGDARCCIECCAARCSGQS